MRRVGRCGHGISVKITRSTTLSKSDLSKLPGSRQPPLRKNQKVHPSIRPCHPPSIHPSIHPSINQSIHHLLHAKLISLRGCRWLRCRTVWAHCTTSKLPSWMHSCHPSFFVKSRVSRRQLPLRSLWLPAHWTLQLHQQRAPAQINSSRPSQALHATQQLDLKFIGLKQCLRAGDCLYFLPVRCCCCSRMWLNSVYVAFRTGWSDCL